VTCRFAMRGKRAMVFVVPSKPPPRPAARPPSAASSSVDRARRPALPAPKPPKGPVRHQTIEVQAAWLEADPPKKSTPSSPPRKGPPPLPGSNVAPPPLPVAEPRKLESEKTMEVDMRWVELVDERERRKASERASSDREVRPKGERQPEGHLGPRSAR